MQASPRFDRRLLLGEPKRNEVLPLAEVVQYGRDSHGDPDYVSIYGLRPTDWFARGVRVLGRTAVECTRDRLGELIGCDVAGIARLASGPAPIIVDLFAGSANTLYWIQRQLPGSRGVGFELDDAVFAATQRNLSILGVDLELRHVGFEAGLQTLEVADGQLVIAFVAPPWGDALSDASGLDLSRTTPPVSAVVDLLDERFPQQRLLVAIQIYETVEPASLAVVRGRLDWSVAKTYTINAPGENHGVVLGTIRWRPAGRQGSGT